MTNSDIARRLMTYARELAGEGGNVYRIRAYRAAAEQIERMTRSLADVWRDHGRAGLESLPGIGKSIAYTLEGLINEGEVKTVKPIDHSREPERLFTSLPGVGHKLAEQIRDRLGITTLDELESAARDGRLAQLGVGTKRLAGILAALAQRAAPAVAPLEEPSLEDLLALDEDYRACTDSEELFAPRRYEPDGERCLGVSRSERGGWSMKALYANSALAHRLERSRDWVVIYYQRGETQGQRTIATETRGEMAGRRVVRGRERECRAYYGVAALTSEPAA